MKEQAHHIGLGLLMEGSVLGLVLGAWLWGILTLGAHHAMAAQQSLSPEGENLPGYVVRCSGAHSLKEEGTRSVGSGDGSGCLREARSGMSTSRHPRAGLTEQQGHPADH